MKTLIAILTLAAGLPAQAAVMIYKIAQTNVYTGGGATFKEVVAGRLVFDVEGKQVTKLLTWAKVGGQSYYQIDCPEHVIAYATGPHGAESSAFFLNAVNTDAEGFYTGIIQGYLRGTNNLLTTTAGSPPIRAARTMRGIWREWYQGDAEYLIEAGVFATYQPTATQTANAKLQTVDNVIDALITTFEAAGWIESDPEVPCF